MTVTDCVEMGIENTAKQALEVAWGDGVDAVWLSFDVDCLDAAFVPGTGWPELLAAPWSTVTSFLKNNRVYTHQGLFWYIPSILPKKQALRLVYRLLPPCSPVSD